MQERSGTALVFSAWLGVVFVFSLVVALCVAPQPALAVDPECAYDELPEEPTLIDATSGTIVFCSPSVDEHGNAYPETGYPMKCSVEIDGEVRFVTDPIGPGVAFAFADATLTFEHEVQAWCSNDGEGGGHRLAAQPVPARFPAAAPGRPHLVPST